MGAPDIRSVLAINIRRAMEREGISLIMAADRAGVARSHLFAVLRGDKRPTVDWLDKFARSNGLEAWQLLKPGAFDSARSAHSVHSE